MKVCGSEFARMAGVSAMAVSKLCKSGRLVREGRWLDTEVSENAFYLAKHGFKGVREVRSESCDYLSAEGFTERNMSLEAKKLLQALKTIEDYIVQSEKARLESSGKARKEIDPGKKLFIRFLVEKLQLNNLDDKYVNEAMLMTIDPVYRLEYMLALKESRMSAAE